MIRAFRETPESLAPNVVEDIPALQANAGAFLDKAVNLTCLLDLFVHHFLPSQPLFFIKLEFILQNFDWLNTTRSSFLLPIH